MLALRIEYLTGRATATAFNDRGSAEWPPHPARIYSALAATWFETEGDDDERDALRWLSAQGAPALAASPASERDVVPVFVPVNDTTVLPDLARPLEKVEAAERTLQGETEPKGIEKARKALAKAQAEHEERCRAAVVPGKVTSDGKKFALGLLPERRTRQPRTFPSVTPDDPVVHVVWGDADPTRGQRDALRKLARRVSRIGHSSSLVSCDVVDGAPPPSWVSDDTGAEVFRTVEDGQLDRLERAFTLHQGVEPRVLPARFTRYRQATAAVSVAGLEVPRSVFHDDWIVLIRRDGPRLPVWRAVDLASAVRGALMAHAEQPAGEILTGHASPGVPSDRPHAAFVPLPHVGEHGDGTLLGVAIVLPRSATSDERDHVYGAIARWAGAGPMRATLGRAGALTLALPEDRPVLSGQRARTWCRPSRNWASATPVALDRNPGDLLGADFVRRQEAHRTAERIVADAIERVGLPRPAAVEVSFRPPLVGSAKVDRGHPPFPPRSDRVRRVQVHVRVAFDELVRGPMLVGAGRYFGLGLLRPVEER